MECRKGCAACCEALSISSPIPGMPQGKSAGVVCVNLDKGALICRIWSQKEYPEVCLQFTPGPLCGSNRTEAMENLSQLEVQTKPDRIFGG